MPSSNEPINESTTQPTEKDIKQLQKDIENTKNKSQSNQNDSSDLNNQDKPPKKFDGLYWTSRPSFPAWLPLTYRIMVVSYVCFLIIYTGVNYYLYLLPSYLGNNMMIFTLITFSIGISYHFYSFEKKNNVGLCIRFYSAMYTINYTVAFVVFIWNTCF